MIYSLVADLAHFVESAASADVGLLDLVGTVDDRGTHTTSHAIHVGLAQAAERGDTSLEEEMRRQVGHTLLCQHDIWLEGNDLE